MRYITVIILSLLSLSASAQKIRFTNPNNSWVYKIYGNVICTGTRTLAYSADSVILGTPYKHLAETYNMVVAGGCTPYSGSENYFVREDTLAGIIYYRNTSATWTDTGEQVYFNYNFHVGDTLFHQYGSNDYVIALDSTIINGVFHKVFIMGSGGATILYTFIEGVGCLMRPYANFMENCIDSHEELRCFSQSSVIPAFNLLRFRCAISPDTFKNIESCNTLLVDNIFIGKAKPVRIFPNPATDHLDIFIDDNQLNDVSISFTDISGRCLYTKKLDKNTNSVSIPTTFFAQGLYLISVKNNGQLVVNEKVTIVK